MSHADIAISATALPSDNAPRTTASTTRAMRGLNNAMADSSGSGERTVSPHIDHPVGDVEHTIAVSDDDDGVAPPGAIGDRGQHCRLGGSVEMGRRLVEE